MVRVARKSFERGDLFEVVPGRTFFEVRQILRICCSVAAPACPPGLACTLKELEGHAHR